MKIDVIMITNNSQKPCLVESINSIVDNIPLNRLIVVDNFSSDETINIIKSYSNINTIIIQKYCNRGMAREIGIKKVETDWFAFVDSDIILEKDWFKLIANNLSKKIGAIEGNVKSKEGVVQKIRTNGRGYTNCTLIKTDLVKDIKIPEDMVVYEDQYIRKYIEKNGYKWLKVASPCSVHLSKSNRLNDAFEIGKMSGKYQLDPFWKYPSSFFIIVIKRIFGGQESPLISYRLLTGYLRGVFSKLYSS